MAAAGEMKLGYLNGLEETNESFFKDAKEDFNMQDWVSASRCESLCSEVILLFSKRCLRLVRCGRENACTHRISSTYDWAITFHWL